MGCHSCKNRKVYQAPVVVPLNTLPQQQISTLNELYIAPSTFVIRKKTPIQREYSMGPRLGAGAFGSVRRAIHKATGQYRAVKTVKKRGISSDLRENTQFFSEVDILSQADHPNIIKLYEFYEDPYSVHIVTQLVTGGELFDYLITHRLLSEKIAAHFFRQLISAVYYCHNKGIVHRDLKPENLLLEGDGETATLKVIDFGTSTLIKESERLKHKYGTAYYIAPEVINKNYDAKCDIWSCGVILYLLLSGTPPFNGQTEKEILAAVRKGTYTIKGGIWENISTQAKTLVTSMLEINPQRRLSAGEVLQHEWFRSAVNSSPLPPEEVAKSFQKLSEFRSNLKLQHAVLTFITAQLASVEETQKLTELFRSMDENGDGKLSREELVKAFQETMDFEDAQQAVDEIMEHVDTDLNGYIEYSEFVVAMAKRDSLLSTENLEVTFRMFDIDGNGTISMQELKEVLGRGIVSDDQIWVELIEQVDTNGDGEIDLEEFKDMMMKLKPK